MAAVTDHISGEVPARRGITAHATIWILLALTLAALWPTFTALARIWSTQADYEHGFAIGVIAAVWLFQLRDKINECPVRPERLGLIGLVGALALWLIAFRANSELMQQLVVPVAILFAVLSASGVATARLVAAPILYFYFAVPIWGHLIPVLQAMTVHVTEAAMALMNVPAEVEGHHVTIPAGQFSIIEGCAGGRYFITGLAFAALAAAVNHIRGRRLVYVFCAAVGLALITNWMRVIIVIYAGHVSDMQHYLVATEHETLGYVMFAPMLLMIGLVTRRLAGCPTGSSHSLDGRSAGASAHWMVPAALLIVPVLLWAWPVAINAKAPALGPLPLLTGEWQGPLPASSAWKPSFVSPAEERSARYLRGGQSIEVYLNTYGPQSPGRELVFHSNSVMPADRWTLVQRLPRIEHGPSLSVVADQAGARWVIGGHYVVAGRDTAHPALAQLYYGIGALVKPVPSGTVAMATACAPSCAVAVQGLEAFWAENAALFLATIPEVM